MFAYENFLFIYLFYKLSVWQLFYTLLTDVKSSLVVFIYPVNANNSPTYLTMMLFIVDQFDHVLGNIGAIYKCWFACIYNIFEAKITRENLGSIDEYD